MNNYSILEIQIINYLFNRCLVLPYYRNLQIMAGVQLLSSHLPECEEFCTNDATPPSSFSS